MGIIESRYQKNVPVNHKRYEFNKYLNGKRAYHTVVCRKSEVDKLYYQWEEKILMRLDGSLSNALFFESIGLYFINVRRDRSHNWVEQVGVIIEKTLKPLYGNILVSDFRRVHIQKLIDHLQDKGLKPSTVNNYINTMSGFFRWASTREDENGNCLYEKNNPCSGMRLKENNTRDIYLTGDMFLEVIEKSRQHKGLEIFIMLALFTGLRRSEIIGLKWFDIILDVNPDIRRIHLLCKDKIKNRKVRSVPIPDILYEFLIQNKHEKESVVPVSDKTIERQWYKLRTNLSFIDQLTVDQLRIHDLRHVFAQSMRDAGVRIEDISAFMGHSSIEITQKRYAQSGGHDGVKKVNNIEKFVDVDRIRSGFKMDCCDFVVVSKHNENVCN